MPPRRTSRAVSGASAAPPPSAASSRAPRPSRARKASIAPTVDDQDGEDRFPGDSDDAEEEEVVVKPKSKRAAPVSKPKAKTGRAAKRIVSDEEDEAPEPPAEEEEEEVVKPVSKRAAPTSKGKAPASTGKAPAVPAKRKSARISMASAAEESSVADEDEAGEAGEKPRSRKVSSGRARKVVKQEPVEAVKEDESAVESMTEEDPAEAAAEAPEAPVEAEEDEVEAPPSAQPVPVPAIATEDSDEESDYEEADVTVRLDSALNISGTNPLAPPATPRLIPPSPFGFGGGMNDKTPTGPSGAGGLGGPSSHSFSRGYTVPPSPSPAAAPPPPPGPKPRLTIHKIVLINFKSYAGRQEIGPFHKSFSAIVGPNGSGKSNTIDALLFVFGYRASKMRQGKLSELIHNSAGKEGLESCSVEVWFREIVDLPGVDNFLLVPNSQLVVNRTAYRNNSSKYTINERTSTFTEVTTLLKAKGIDLDHNRFLILQGEVESIALMKPKAGNEHEDGLLEYLEDIIGTTKYKVPIEEAEQEVEKLNEDRLEKFSRLKVVERERAALEDKKTEAEDYLRDSNELVRKKSLLWQYHMNTLTHNVEITTKAIDSLTAELTDEQDRNAHHLAEISSLQQAYDDKLAAFEEVKKFTEKLVKDSKKFEKEEVGLLERKKHLGTRVKKVKKSLTDDGHARNEALGTIENCASELEKNRIKVADLEAKLVTEEAELEEIRDSLKGKTDHFTTQIEAKQRELEPWTAKISEKQSAIDVATSERDLLAQKAEGVVSALAEAKANLDLVKKGDEGKRGEYEGLKVEKGKVVAELKEKEKSLEGMAAKGEDLRNRVSSSRSKTDDAKASLQADKSENAVLSSLNKLKAQGRIKGFHGRLGDLGVIDDKYDVAVTTACSALNNLVVDTVEQGQACIEHLRKGNVGRASFMVLEKLPPRDLNAIETPENVPRLFDLIRPKDPRFAPAFYKGLFNTLVADDLAQAQRIGYGKKRWRVVTLAGQLIDPSGTMSGGGTRVSRGGMSSKFTANRVEPEVVARLERELGDAERELAAFQAERKVLESEVAKLRKRVPEIEMQMEKAELDVKTGEKRIAEAEKRLAELQSQSKPDAADEKRIASLSSEIASLIKETDKLRVQSSSISSEIKSLQEKILEAGGVKLRAIQSRVATTKGLLDLASEAITKAEVAQAKSERDADKLGKALERNKTALEEVEAELQALQGELDAVQSDLGVIRGKVQEASDAVVDVQEGLGESKKELDEKTDDINAFRKLEMDIKQKIEDNQKIQKDSRGKHEHWRKRHDELELQYIDEDDEDDEEEAEGGEAPKPADDAPMDAAPAQGADGNADPEEGEEASAPVGKPKRKRRKAETFELVEYSPDELATVDKELLNAEITQLEEEIGKARPNMTVLEEYRKRDAEFLSRAQDHDNVIAARDAAKARCEDLTAQRMTEFMAGFTAISTKLKEMYQMITMGGNAEIECIDNSNPFSEGVVLSIMPPKKSWRQIANLSGGEKTLASLALVFALHVFKPTPLYFMDEIDAALDFKNVSIVANYIQQKTQAAQFIVISLRNDMFELAHRLVGIYKTSNCTKSIAIDNKDLRTQAVPRRLGPAGRSPTKGGSQSQRNGSPERRGSVVPGTPRPGMGMTPGPSQGLGAGLGQGLMVPSTPRPGSVVPSTPGTVRG